MIVTNCNGAPFGEVILDNDGYVRFKPKKGWSPGFSAHQLEEIAKKMRRLEE